MARRATTCSPPDARALDAERALRDLFSGFGSALVAFSGGVDSAFWPGSPTTFWAIGRSR